MTTSLFFGTTGKLESTSTVAAWASNDPGALCACLGQALARWPVWLQHKQSPKDMRRCLSCCVNWPSGPRIPGRGVTEGIARGSQGWSLVDRSVGFVPTLREKGQLRSGLEVL